MKAGQTSSPKIHNTLQVVPFNNLLFPPFSTLNTSPPPGLTETKVLKHFDLVITLYIAIGRIYNQMSGTENVSSDWHEGVGSNVCCHLLLSQCFLLSSARPQAVSLILFAL